MKIHREEIDLNKMGVYFEVLAVEPLMTGIREMAAAGYPLSVRREEDKLIVESNDVIQPLRIRQAAEGMKAVTTKLQTNLESMEAGEGGREFTAEEIDQELAEAFIRAVDDNPLWLSKVRAWANG